MPNDTPIMSAIQSFMSPLRLKLGWINSMAPPNPVAPMKTVKAKSTGGEEMREQQRRVCE